MSAIAARWSLILIGALMAMRAYGQEPVRVFAAGSLRAPLTAIAQEFEQTVQQPVQLTFGASGLLRDRIAGGEPAASRRKSSRRRTSNILLRWQPSLHSVPMPESLRVGAVYGVVVRRDAPKVANAFAAFLTSALGQRKLAQFGFDRP